MKILRDFTDVPADCRGAVVAIGNYDGVHKGHQAVLGIARDEADRQGVSLAVLAFEPHPRNFFDPALEPFRLTPFEAKAIELDAIGVDILFALPFDEAMSQRQAVTFVDEVLMGGLHAGHVVVGYDFRFGKGRTGDPEKLKDMLDAHNIGLTVIDPVSHDGEVYSSTLIREYLQAGKPRDAAKLLGHWWKAEGTVQKGDQRGRTIGFPTANILLSDYIDPAHGVYTVRAQVKDGDKTNTYGGVANIGHRPMFHVDVPLLEVYLFDYNEEDLGDGEDGALYGKQIVVSFLEYLRPEQKFDGLEELTAQIAKDSDLAREQLKLPEFAEGYYRN